MWAHGVPEYILTSIHSADSDIQGRGTYNRLVSTKDGSSLRWMHDDVFKECDRICDEGVDSRPRTEAAIETLRKDPRTAAHFASSDVYKDMRRMTLMVNDYLRGRSFAKRLTKADMEPKVREVLGELRAEGLLGREVPMPSCMIHVVFERRYGGNKAACLK
jgi:hypothetical protein